MFFLKRFSPHTLFSRTSPYSIFVAQCSTASPSHLTFSHPNSKNVRVSVWWDLDNCAVPLGVKAFGVAQAITAAIESTGIKGPIQIKAFGDMSRLARTDQEALSKTRINLTHIPYGEAHKSLNTDLLIWFSINAPPAHLFLISGDTDLARILHRLRLQNYNILLASKAATTHVVLKSAATNFWNWDDLVRGKNLTGKIYNQPPNDSWYGRYEGPIEDPFTEIYRPELRRNDSKSVAPDDHEGFSQDSFWIDLQTFINTALGSLLIAESRTRGNMAYYLQEYGPSVLRSLTENDVLRMVDILIIEKKWVLESPHLSIPFKLTPSAGITSSGDAQGSSGL